MDGLNKKFIDKPEEFLRSYVMGEDYKLRHLRTPRGVYYFDLVPVKADKKNVAELHKVDPEAHKGEELIKAYWLPWFSKNTSEIELGYDVSYFFTASLDGCRLQIVPAISPDCNIKVLHIAGDKGGEADDGDGQGGTDWRDKEAEKKLTSEERSRSRAFSVSEETPHGYKQYEDQWVFVVGFIRELKKEFLWEFWAQPRERALTENPILQEPWKIWPADARKQRGERCVIS